MATTPPTGRASVPGALPSSPRSVGRASLRARVGSDQGRDGGLYGGDMPGQYRTRTRPRPRWGRIALVGFVALLLLASAAGVAGYFYVHSLDKKVHRTDAFGGINGGRPPKEVAGAQNILVLGSDSRDPSNRAQAGAWRTDTIILVHVPADHQKAYLISIPRDLYVYIPQSSTDHNLGDTHDKINAAFAWGGVPLTVQTVEEFTGVRIDHVALIDFGGFQEVTDALGGVDLNIDQSITSIHPPYRHFNKGMNHLNGAEALDWVRQRYQFADGDFSRMRHQQEFLKALMDKAVSTGTLANPGKLNGFLQAVAKAVTVDQDMSIVDLAWTLHNLRSSDLTFMTSPYSGTDTIDDQSVVVSDKAKATALYDAVAKDQVAAWLAQTSPSAKPGG